MAPEAAAQWAPRSSDLLGGASGSYDSGATLFNSNVRRDLANGLEKTAKKSCACGKSCKGLVPVSAFFGQYEALVAQFAHYTKLVAPPSRGGGSNRQARQAIVTAYDRLAIAYNRLLRWTVANGHRCPSPDHSMLVSILLRQVEPALSDGWDLVTRLSLDWARNKVDYLVTAITEPFLIDTAAAQKYRSEFRAILVTRTYPLPNEAGFSAAAAQQKERELQRLRFLDDSDRFTTLSRYPASGPALPSQGPQPQASFATPQPAPAPVRASTLGPAFAGPLPPFSSLTSAATAPTQQAAAQAATAVANDILGRHDYGGQAYHDHGGGVVSQLRLVRKSAFEDPTAANYPQAKWAKVGQSASDGSGERQTVTTATATSATATVTPSAFHPPSVKPPPTDASFASVAPTTTSAASTGWAAAAAPPAYPEVRTSASGGLPSSAVGLAGAVADSDSSEAIEVDPSNYVECKQEFPSSGEL